MTQRQIKVIFQYRKASHSGPQDRTVYVLAGTKIIEAAAIAGVTINVPCGGAGICGKCRVKIISPQTMPTKADKKMFRADELKENYRLACQNAVSEDSVIEVPRVSPLDRIVVDSDVAKRFEADKRYAGKDKCFGIAIDLGTTTLAASLINLQDDAEMAVMGGLNPQVACGDDVISRIKHAANRAGLDELQRLVIGQINGMIDQLCGQGRIRRQNIYEITIAGNTTMEHLVCGIDPTPLGQLPFKPSWLGANTLKASELEISINPEGIVYMFPIIGGFVGGDIASDILAADILNQPQPVLLVDIGTNGEIVLVNDNKIMAASTAAGPAFEGARISCGTRAANGAIEQVKFDGDCVYSVIGNVEPTGICGSGLIDITAELLDAGIVDYTGKINQSAEVAPKIAQRITADANGQPAFVIEKKIEITQQDIRQIQLAVGAIRAGINIMLKKAGINAADLKRILIAGGFGSFIRRNHAQRIGLLPANIDHQIISFIGNSSLAGAKLALLSVKARQKAQEFAAKAQHIELSADSDFQNEFASAMIFPVV
ncbi:MAG: DUF4445 domain-containing protein [Planctomycetes bacterium]|nr:DUF4445 domain-containing protein [Planctomycetota bacterium]MBU1518439.1 DUF4445 domain-containing protein [Planctomycetota bacterium]MBU2458043.1 DUF4445 domain-containing protein [Planctomycetota bacterium]MBU2596851.1 DUF4445 domain-containing protein [Planctomycetota bacterium]